MRTGYTTFEQILGAMSADQLETELEACLKEWPKCKTVRIRKAMAILIADVALELQARCIDEWACQLGLTHKPNKETP